MEDVVSRAKIGISLHIGDRLLKVGGVAALSDLVISCPSRGASSGSSDGVE